MSSDDYDARISELESRITDLEALIREITNKPDHVVNPAWPTTSLWG